MRTSNWKSSPNRVKINKQKVWNHHLILCLFGTGRKSQELSDSTLAVVVWLLSKHNSDPKNPVERPFSGLIGLNGWHDSLFVCVKESFPPSFPTAEKECWQMWASPTNSECFFCKTNQFCGNSPLLKSHLWGWGLVLSHFNFTSHSIYSRFTYIWQI